MRRHRLALTVGLSVLGLLPAGWATAAAGERIATVAVFPVENLSGGGIPADAIRQSFVDRLSSNGTTVLADEALDAFMTRHRVRYAAGIDAATAEVMREETGTDAVLIVSVEFSSEMVPPKVALMARLVSIQAAPVLAWADDVGLAGDESPGLLGLGLVNEYETVLTRALDTLADSLLRFLQTGEARSDLRRDSRFRPRVAYQGLHLGPGSVYTVAVLPFFNRSARRGAGESLALLFMRHLSGFAAFRIIDAGDVRQQLLQARVIMEGGISLSDAERVADILDADFVLGGRVLYYEDHEGPEAAPRVDFSTVLIERRTRKVVWNSHSYNDGTDGVRFFGRGRLTTAHAMATQMVRLTTEMIAGGGK